MILGNLDILRLLADGSDDLVISPFDPKKLGPCSYDVTLGPEIKYRPRCLDKDSQEIDVFAPPEMRSLTMTSSGCLLWPGQLYLGHTFETVGTSVKYVADVSGKSSLARLGLAIHQTAGWFDPGFVGEITLEFGVVGDRPIRVYPGMDIGQVRFTSMGSNSGYVGRYNGQTGATASRYHIGRSKT